MASFLFTEDELTTQQLRRELVFRDRANPLDYLCDAEIVERYELPRHFIIDMIDLIAEDHTEKPPSSCSHTGNDLYCTLLPQSDLTYILSVKIMKTTRSISLALLVSR
jgi:hypothetical protein